MPVLKLPLSEQSLAPLHGEGDLEFFIALPIDGQRTVLHVHIRRRKVYDHLYSTARMHDRPAHEGDPPLVEGARLEPD